MRARLLGQKGVPPRLAAACALLILLYLFLFSSTPAPHSPSPTGSARQDHQVGGEDMHSLSPSDLAASRLETLPITNITRPVPPSQQLHVILFTPSFDSMAWEYQFPLTPARFFESGKCGADVKDVCTFHVRHGDQRDFDAEAWVMLHQRLPPVPDLVDYRQRSSKVKWIHYNQESPQNVRWYFYPADGSRSKWSPIPPQIRFLFNATLSYALHSDIMDSYGAPMPLQSQPQGNQKLGLWSSEQHRQQRDIKPKGQGKHPFFLPAESFEGIWGGGARKPPRDFSPQKFWASKTKGILWVVSNCRPERARVADRLAELMPGQTDYYGACFKRSLPKDVQVRDAALDYKFYLSFENSFCPDYVTEKYWNMLGRAIPVVMGTPTRDILIPGSYIRVEDFDSLESLAAHLTRVAADPELYASYFTWMQHYRPGGEWNDEHWSCRVCRYLHHTRGQHKVVDLNEMYNEARCVVPPIATLPLPSRWYHWFIDLF